MALDIQTLFYKKIKRQQFNRTIGLFGATTIGVGALMGAGIYVLIGEAAKTAGPSLVGIKTLQETNPRECKRT